MLTVIFFDQTFATVLEAYRIRSDIGPNQEWYTENLRYYYLFLPTVDGSLSRRFGFLITALSLFASMFIMLRRKRVPGVARGPAWRLMGVIFGTVFFLMFTPTKWVHHFGLFAAVGAAMAALATVLVSPAVLRWSRNRMAFLAAVLFVLALCFATTNGWWYVSSYGAPFNNAMPKIAGITISTVLFALFAIAAVYAAWLHFTSPTRGQGRIARALTAAPIPVAAGFMVVVFVGSMLAGVVRQYPTYSNAWANLRSFTGGCGLADDVLVEPDTNDGFLTPLPGNYGRLGPLGGTDPVGYTPNGVPEKIVAETIRMSLPMPGTDYDWDHPTKLKAPGVNGSTVPLPYGLDPAGFRSRAVTSRARNSRAGSRRPGISCLRPMTRIRWWLSLRRAPSPETVYSTVEATARQSNWSTRAPARTALRCPQAGSCPTISGPIPSWRNLRFARSQIPSDVVAVRIVAEDLSLTPGDWVAVTPPRVPELRSVQEYVGSDEPVLMDWAVGLAFPCQQPMLHANGVTDIPRFRITPDYNAKRKDTDTWQDGLNGGLLGITDLLLRAQVMATYLSRDWGRDWGSLRKFDTIVDADLAQLDFGTATRSGLYSPGHIRIKP